MSKGNKQPAGQQKVKRSPSTRPLGVLIDKMMSVLLIIFTLLSLVSALISIPQLLHPLYGSIPTNLYLTHSYLIAAMTAQWLAAYTSSKSTAHSANLVSSIQSFSVILFLAPLLLRGLARHTSAFLGPTYGPAMTMIPLFAAMMLSGKWVLTASSRYGRIEPLEGRAKLVVFVLAVIYSAVDWWFGIRLNNKIKSAILSASLRKEVLLTSLGIFQTLLSSGLRLHFSRTQNPSWTQSSSSNSIVNTILRLGQLSLLVLAILPSSSHSPLHTPKTPYFASFTGPKAEPQLRVLDVKHSITGLVMVADNLKDSYRYLRCDHSFLGGRWMRMTTVDGEVEGKGGEVVQLGDSVFSTFTLQEASRLIYRNEQRPEQQPKTLIVGLGAGVAAKAMLQHGHHVHVVEIDPAVYTFSTTYLGLPIPQSVSIMDGSQFVMDKASSIKASLAKGLAQSQDRFDHLIHDCFTGGSVPGELFTKEFWDDVAMSMVEDGVVTLNYAGQLSSKASKAVLVTLLSSFPQCRAFTDALGISNDTSPDDLQNMVIFCSTTFSPLLTFKPPTLNDYLQSPLRKAVLSNFLPYEVHLDAFLSPEDMINPELILRRGRSQLDHWQVGSALSTWKAMREIMPVSMWSVY